MIYDIIRNTVDTLHKLINVTNQVDNGDGTYTLTLSEVYLIRAGGYILGDNSERYKVNSISGLDIVVTKSDTDILAQIQCLQPYFYAGQWQDYNNHLEIENMVYSENKERFPSVFLVTEYTEDENTEFEPTGIQIILSDYTIRTNNNERQDNEFNYLTTLRKEFLRQLNKNAYVIRLQNESTQKIFNSEHDTNNATNRVIITLDITHQITVNGC
jgi:hypothetical protein